MEVVTMGRPAASNRPDDRVVMRGAINALRERMPPGWRVEETTGLPASPGAPDARLRVTAPDGTNSTIVVEAKAVLDRAQVPAVHDQVNALLRDGEVGLVVARYLSRQARERLAQLGLSYVDLTGNILVRLAKPGLHIADHGADGDPWRGPGRPRGTLKGAPAAKVVRTLLDIDQPWAVRELVTESGASTGSVYRVIEFLTGEELATKDSQARLVVLNWIPLLRRWSEDYGFVRTNRTTRWIAPRGLPALMDRIATASVPDYALTGTLAAASWAPYAPARAAMIYSADVERAAAAWGLRPAEAGANVLLAEPAFPVLTARLVTNDDGLKLAATAQVAVDLLTGPGRGPSEAEELITWMEHNEPAWR